MTWCHACGCPAAVAQGAPAPALKRPAAACGAAVAKRHNTLREKDFEEPVPKFSGCGHAAPVKFRGCAIYTSVAKRCWRVKLAAGDRHDKPVPFGQDPAAAWVRVLELCKTK